MHNDRLTNGQLNDLHLILEYLQRRELEGDIGLDIDGVEDFKQWVIDEKKTRF